MNKPSIKVRTKQAKQNPDYMPPTGQAILLGLQHVLAMFAGNVTVPIILAGALGSNAAERAFLIQAALFVSGVATMIQTVGLGRIGARLPIVQGTSFGFIPVLVPIAKTFGLAAVFGAALIAGVIQFFLGTVLDRLRSFFPPLVSGLVVVTIGLSLIPVGIRYAAGGAGAADFGAAKHLLLAGFVMLVIILLRQFLGTLSFFATGSIFIGLLAGYLLAIPLGMVDSAGIRSAAWFAMPTPLKYGFSFPLAAIVGMLIMAFITTIESVGDISGITIAGAEREAKDRELSGGIMADGLGTVFAAFFNALPNSSYSQNVGLIAFTGLMSRHVVTIGAAFLILAGLMPKLGALVAAMPLAVLGGGTIIMFGMIVSSGLKLLLLSELNRHDLFVIALSLSVGLGFLLVPEAAAIFPEPIQILLVSGIIPVALIAMVFNNWVPARASEE